MNVARVFPVFSVIFVIVYACSVDFNLALFTYHPQLNQFGWLVEPPKAGPAMYWYGWILTSTLAALFGSALALLLPRSWARWIWPGWTWLVPIAAIAFFVYLLKGYFLR